MLRAPRTAEEGRAWLICDSAALRKFGIGMVLPGARNARSLARAGYLVQATSLRELAGKLGIDADSLEQEVQRNNAFAATGEDVDFGKGTSYFNRFHGDAEQAPNPCLGPLSEGPFSAVELRPADLSIFAGIRTNAHAQVLNAHGEPIHGLYAAGNDMASI
jgi:predicted oxidoreductase